MLVAGIDLIFLTLYLGYCYIPSSLDIDPSYPAVLAKQIVSAAGGRKDMLINYH